MKISKYFSEWHVASFVGFVIGLVIQKIMNYSWLGIIGIISFVCILDLLMFSFIDIFKKN